MGTRAVSEDQVRSIGGVLRGLDEILTEVADGRSEMIYLGERPCRSRPLLG